MRDVIVVGAGPAGSYAAYSCASMGLDTLLLEKERLPREKACGGAAGRVLESYCGEEILDIVERRGRGSRLYFNYRKIGALNKEKLFFKREKLDHFITEMAMNAGCEVVDGTEVVSVSPHEDGVRVITERERHQTQVVIGGDGAYSVVGRSAGLVNETKRHYAAVSSNIDVGSTKSAILKSAHEEAYQHTYFFSDLLGFAWIIPNRTSVNTGMGALMNKSVNLKRKYRAFLSHLGLDELPPVKGHLIPYQPLEKAYSERVLLVGDAGGFVNPWTGCGIDLGVVSGKAAADACKSAFDEEDFSEQSLSRYQVSLAPVLRNLRLKSNAIAFLDNHTPKDYVMNPLGKVLVKHLARIA